MHELLAESHAHPHDIFKSAEHCISYSYLGKSTALTVPALPEMQVVLQHKATCVSPGDKSAHANETAENTASLWPWFPMWESVPSTQVRSLRSQGKERAHTWLTPCTPF